MGLPPGTLWHGYSKSPVWSEKSSNQTGHGPKSKAMWLFKISEKMQKVGLQTAVMRFYCGHSDQLLSLKPVINQSLGEIMRWMEEILQQFIGDLSHYLWAFNHPGWCRISSIHSITSRKCQQKSENSQKIIINLYYPPLIIIPYHPPSIDDIYRIETSIFPYLQIPSRWSNRTDHQRNCPERDLNRHVCAEGAEAALSQVHVAVLRGRDHMEDPTEIRWCVSDVVILQKIWPHRTEISILGSHFQ